MVKWTNTFIEREYATRSRRRGELQSIISNELALGHDESSITLMTLNSGYSYLFLNWLCGLHLMGIAEDIRKSTIVIATDEKTELVARRVGFQVAQCFLLTAQQQNLHSMFYHGNEYIIVSSSRCD